MGLDLVPLGKPREGYEKRFEEIFHILGNENSNLPEEEIEKLQDEWFSIQESCYEFIQAPLVGRDKEADDWVLEKYEELEDKSQVSKEDFIADYQGYYVVELAKRKGALPFYMTFSERHNFRGQFLSDCIEMLGEDLVNEAWESKLANDALDYANRLTTVADKIAKEHNLEYLKDQETISDDIEEGSLESNLHITYSLARWLKLYAENGYGYHADW